MWLYPFVVCGIFCLHCFRCVKGRLFVLRPSENPEPVLLLTGPSEAVVGQCYITGTCEPRT